MSLYRQVSSLRNFSSAASTVEKTALYNFHLKNKGKIVNFGGYLLPVQYEDLSISASHLHTRKHASIFDVSHMLQTYVRGKKAVQTIESLCTADIKSLRDNCGSLTVFTNNDGCILDDLIVTKVHDELLYIVSNAAMKKQDMEIMETSVNEAKKNGEDVSIEFLTPFDRSLIAVQGPSAKTAVQSLTKSTDLSKLYFMSTTEAEIAGVSGCRITRCGYTGEDGFEISVPSEHIETVVEGLLQEDNVKLAGLGARDSLRLEAGLCLYGSDIDAKTTPIEAALTWLVAKSRRTEANFPGADVINNQIKNGTSIKRIGLRMVSGPPARSGVDIVADDGKKVGHVTSGCPSPSLGGNVGMGYIETPYMKIGSKIKVNIRGKLFPAEIAKMPFVPAHYFAKPKK